MTTPKGPKASESTPFTSGFTPGEISSQMQQFAAQWAQSVHEQIDRFAQAAEQWQAAAWDAARKAVDMVAPRA